LKRNIIQVDEIIGRTPGDELVYFIIDAVRELDLQPICLECTYRKSDHPTTEDDSQPFVLIILYRYAEFTQN
jgi:hypothetical protein